MPEFLGTLLNFQHAGVEIIGLRNMLIGDEAGVGKTAQAIYLAKDKPRVLVLTMSSLKYQFEAEIKKFLGDGIATIVVNGTPAQRTAQWHSDKQFYIANYELLLRDLPFMQKFWGLIIADECTRLSNPLGKQYKALKKLQASQRIAMTGTAISNSPIDCFGIFDWLNPGSLGNYWAFLETFTIRQLLPSGGKMVVGFRNLEDLARKIQPYYIRRTKVQVLPELPGKVHTEIPFELSAKERKLYDQIKKRMLIDLKASEVSKIEHISQLDNGIVNMMRLRQLVCSSELIGELGEASKLQVLKDLVETLNK